MSGNKDNFITNEEFNQEVYKEQDKLNNNKKDTKSNIISNDEFNDQTYSGLKSDIVPIITSTSGSFGRGSSQYDNISDPVSLLENLNAVRAERQGWLDEAGNATLGIIGGVLTAVESSAYILDLPSHIDVVSSAIDKIRGSEEIISAVDDNFVSSTAKEMKESLYQEHFPIYKKDPSKLIDFNDSAFYWEAFRSVTESAVGFGATGLGAGALVKGLGQMARYSAYMNRLNKGAEIFSKAAMATGRGLKSGTAGRVATAYLTNHGESKMMALELYETAQKEIYDEYIETYQKDNAGEMPSSDDIDEFKLDAKIAAGRQANSFMLTNKVFMATDYLALNRMFGKGITPSRNLMKKPPTTKIGQVGKGLKDNLINAPKEGIEEAGQVAFQQEGQFQARKNLRAKGYEIEEDDLDSMGWVERMGEFITSEQALLEGAMGLIGGPIQYSITQLPFENFSGQRKQYAHQQGVIKSSEDYAERNLFNIVTNEALAKDMEERVPSNYSEEMVEGLNDVAFKGLVNRNLAAGTSETLENIMNDMKEEKPELADKINNKIKVLNNMEQSYNNNSKNYTNPLQIMNFQSNREFLNHQDKFLKKYSNEIEGKFRNLVEIANEEAGTNYTPNMAMDLPIDDFNTKFQQVLEQYQPVIDEYKGIKNNIKKINKLILENEKGEIQYKDSVNNDLLNRFNGVVDNLNMSTEEKIAEYKNIEKAVRGDVIKKNIGRVLAQTEEELFNTQMEHSVDKKGGAKNAEEQVKRDNLIKEFDNYNLDNVDKTVQDQLNDNFEDFILDNEILTPEELNDRRLEQVEKNWSDEELYKAIAEDKKIQSEYQKMVEAVGGEEVLNQKIDEAVNNAQNETEAAQNKIIQSVDANDKENNSRQENLDQVKKPVNVNNETGAAINYPTLTNEKVLQDSENHEEIDNNIDGVKLNFYARNADFRKFLNDNTTNKQGLPVNFDMETDTSALNTRQKNALRDFRAGKKLTKEMVEQLPIKATITGADGNTYVTTMYSVNRSKDNENAAKTEAKLRQDIMVALRKGITPMTTVNYQYSGTYTSDGKQKSIFEISEINKAYEQNKDLDDVPLYYVDTNGRIKDIATDSTIKDFVRTRVKSKGEVWAGVLMTHVTDSNGNKKPLKLNTKSLSDKEMNLIIGLYTLALQKSETNNYNKKIGTIPFIKENLSDPDYAYLGENATVAELLNHLILEGPNTKTINALSQLYIENGMIKFGKYGPMTLNDFSKNTNRRLFKNFLTQFKNRQVKFGKLNTDIKYKKLMLDTVITTDVAVNTNGEVFRSVTEGSDNPQNRYKTKAIYVKTKLTQGQDNNISNQSINNVTSTVQPNPLPSQSNVISTPTENVSQSTQQNEKVDNSNNNTNLANEINEDQDKVNNDMQEVSENMVNLASELRDEQALEEEMEAKLSKARNKKNTVEEAKPNCKKKK